MKALEEARAQGRLLTLTEELQFGSTRTAGADSGPMSAQAARLTQGAAAHGAASKRRIGARREGERESIDD
jgi:hypothetical protein